MKEFKTTTVRLRKTTVEKLRELIKERDRNECIDQIVSELVESYFRLKGLDK